MPVRIPSNPPRRPAAMLAFTLVEVVMALGIFSFAVVAIGGLFFVGIDTNKASSDQIQAANLASLLISTRRAITTGTVSNFALPPLNVSTSGTAMGVANDGTLASSSAETPAYNLAYTTGTTAATGPHLAQVHLMLWWPPAAATPAANSANRYELTTQVLLP